MAAYNFANPAPLFFNILGTAHLSAGSLTFYDIGTTNPRATWSDVGLTILNPNPLNLDSSGRPTVDVFLDGDYTVKLTDGLNGTGATIWTRDVIPGGDSGFTIPPLVAGAYLSNNGAVLQWNTIELLPDPTGQTGRALVSTGSGYTFQAFPTAPTLDISVAADFQRVGDGVSTSKMLTQTGAFSAPATGTPSTTVAVVFPTAYTSVPRVICGTTSQSQPGGPVVIERTAVSTTGFTVRCDVAEGNSGNANIVNAVPMEYIAIGLKTFP